MMDLPLVTLLLSPFSNSSFNQTCCPPNRRLFLGRCHRSAEQCWLHSARRARKDKPTAAVRQCGHSHSSARRQANTVHQMALRVGHPKSEKLCRPVHSRGLSSPSTADHFRVFQPIERHQIRARCHT